MRIHIEDLKFETIIGILDFERTQKQDLIVNLTIDYDYENEFINYADVSESIKSHIQKNKFLLLEDALESLSKYLQENFSLIKKLHLKITKPSIMPNCTVSLSNSYEFIS